MDEYEVGRVYPFLRDGTWGKWKYLGGDAKDAGSWERQISDPAFEPTTFRESVGRGVSDISDGLMQMRLMATNPDHAREFTDIVNAERDSFEARGGSKIFGRGLGNILGTAPAMLAPGGQQTLLARLAAGSLAGATTSAANFAPSGTWSEKGAQTIIGGGAGAIAPEVARAALRGPVAAYRGAAGASTRPAPGSTSLKADYDALGIRPTSAQVTRDAGQFAQEMNYGQLPGVGGPIRAVREAQPEILASRLDDVVPGARQTATSTGRQVQDALGSRPRGSGAFGEMSRRGNELFEAARNAPGIDDVLDAQVFGESVESVLDEFEGAIPESVVRRISRHTQGESPRPMTVADAFRLRKHVNSLNPRDGTPATVGLGRITSQLDQFLENSQAGGEALELFRQANTAWGRRGAAFGTKPMMQSVDDKLAPDDFVQRAIMSGKVDDIRQLRATLVRQGGAEGQEAWDALRVQTVEHLRDRAVTRSGEFSPAGYGRALDQLGDDRLAVLFNAEEIAALRQIGRAAEGLFSTPVSGGIPVGNRSGSAATFMDMASGAAGPIGRLFGPILSHIKGESVVRKALSGSPVPPQSPFNISMSNSIVNPLGRNPFAAVSGALVGGAGR